MYDDNDKPEIGLARKTARNLVKNSKITDFPILLQEIAKHVPDLHIDGKELDDTISGMQATYKGKAFIRYNTYHSNNRNRFTVAHEIGHLLLGHTSPCLRGTDSNSLLEIEANQFAAELLMPLELLKEAIKKYPTVNILARQCWVSKDAMSNRVMETRLYSRLTSWD